MNFMNEVHFRPNVTREVIRFEHFVVIIQFLRIKIILEKNVTFFKLLFIQLFCADAAIFFKRKLRFFFAPQNIEKLPSKKVAHNPTRPRVLTPASIWLCGTETVF